MRQGQTPGEGSSVEAFGRVWDRQLPYWHVGFAAIWLTALIAVALGESPPDWGGIVGGFGVLAAAYVLVGRVALRDQELWVGVIFHVVAWSVVAFMSVRWPGAPVWLLYFALFPLLFTMLPRWAATLGAVLAITSNSIAVWVGDGRPRDEFAGYALNAVVSLGLSLGLGLFITRLVNETLSRAEAIDELRSTQSKLAAVEHERGIQHERERMSQEIHDTLAQGFTSVLALTRAADAALERGDVQAARERLALAQATAADNLAEARLIVAETTSGHLRDRSLVEALERLVDAVAAQSGMAVTLTVEGDPVSVGGAADVVLLRAAQEGLTNARKHARASTVRVRLTYAEDSPTVLTVTDDGVGFTERANAAGFGLDGIRARADQVGGAASITTGVGRGTSLRVEVPR